MRVIKYNRPVHFNDSEVPAVGMGYTSIINNMTFECVQCPYPNFTILTAFFLNDYLKRSL